MVIGMKKVILKIDGMSCSACQNRIEKYLNKQNGVSANVNLVLANAVVEYDEEKVTLKDLNRFIEESGYKSLGIYKEEEQKPDNQKYFLIFYFILAFILIYVSMGSMLGFPIISFFDKNYYPIYYGITLFLLTLPFFGFGFDILKSGIKKILHKAPNMDSLVTTSVLASFFYSTVNLILILKGKTNLVDHLYFESSAMILYFVKLGKFWDQNSKEKSKQAIKELVQITPKTALIKENEIEKEITIDEVKVGDILICKPGMKIAVDGKITKGNTHIEESFITGESIPSKKTIGDNVLAGSMNMDGYIEYKAEKIGVNSTISSIVLLVVEATSTKAPIGKLADKISGYFVPIILILSILTFFLSLILGYSINDAMISFVTVLVVACPCALGLATPLATQVSIGKAAKMGILIKDIESLENAYKTDVVVFDKTGTLTYGNLRISEIKNFSNLKEKDLITLVSSLEQYSSHPISNAFKLYLKEKKLTCFSVTNFKNIPGVGISGIIDNQKISVGNSNFLTKLNIKNSYQEEENNLATNGNSILYVIIEDKVAALIGVKDIIRDNAKDTIQKLKKHKKQVILLSGDNELTANRVANSLGIKDVVANCMPEEKEKYIKKLRLNGKKVMMIGDGINDAPSLASSNTSVSLNSGTDIAADSSDILLINNDLEKIIEILEISKRTIQIITENLFFAFFYNICMIPIAMGLLKFIGISLNPMIASLAMTLSSLTVVFNSLRLRK